VAALTRQFIGFIEFIVLIELTQHLLRLIEVK
jgi:hypothetical protein